MSISNSESRGIVERASRRAVLAGAGAAVAATLIPGVSLTEAFAQRGARIAGGPVDLGAGDIGVMNYAYALEQLEAAYYTMIVSRPYAGINGYERQVLTDLRNHEIAHREFFRRALGANAIPDLQVNFSAVDFASRRSVLETAMTFEDLGVAAYNGGGAAIRSPQLLAAAGRIVSVEARHAAIIRDMLQPLSQNFAGDDVVNQSGLDRAYPPSRVLRTAAPFIATPVSANSLP